MYEDAWLDGYWEDRLSGYDGGPVPADSYFEAYDPDAWADEDEDDDDGMTDAEADADVLASAGWGTDEDYGYFGGGDDW